MLTEKGTLPIGVEYDGKTHKDFEIREQLVADSIAIYDDPDRAGRAVRNHAYAGVCLLAGQIVSLGEIPKEALTPELIMGMHDDDFEEIKAADKRLTERRNSFRDGR
ncbi:MAG: hypothetical protein NTV58_12310 [Deltaproteobacteria bacterium]|nr:hypothetical protein [Deltaproteobacteria bacterium]